MAASEYEQARLDKIRRNRELLEQLGVNQVREELDALSQAIARAQHDDDDEGSDEADQDDDLPCAPPPPTRLPCSNSSLSKPFLSE